MYAGEGLAALGSGFEAWGPYVPYIFSWGVQRLRGEFLAAAVAAVQAAAAGKDEKKGKQKHKGGAAAPPPQLDSLYALLKAEVLPQLVEDGDAAARAALERGYAAHQWGQLRQALTAGAPLPDGTAVDYKCLGGVWTRSVEVAAAVAQWHEAEEDLGARLCELAGEADARATAEEAQMWTDRFRAVLAAKDDVLGRTGTDFVLPIVEVQGAVAELAVAWAGDRAGCPESAAAAGSYLMREFFEAAVQGLDTVPDDVGAAVNCFVGERVGWGAAADAVGAACVDAFRHAVAEAAWRRCLQRPDGVAWAAEVEGLKAAVLRSLRVSEGAGAGAARDFVPPSGDIAPFLSALAGSAAPAAHQALKDVLTDAAAGEAAMGYLRVALVAADAALTERALGVLTAMEVPMSTGFLSNVIVLKSHRCGA
eukprot:TRINITY_DN3084_c0_g1_i8.p1 TRINITY_DN3084_c0_g1~~TRINITY_DN3084_c0_g1_i8.p1  ORF type:complete len:422 (+),score=148.38 TRINITY_DN3084_c0_g1_i8:1795-3060(+)